MMMMKPIRAVLNRLTLLLALLLTVPGLPASATVRPLTDAERAEVTRAETYLNGIKTLRAGFIQGNPDGSVSKGVFSMQRPGKMRLQYDAPNDSLVVSDGLFVSYWDGELQQQSSAPLGSSLADLILRDPVRLEGDITVTRVVHVSGELDISMIETKDPGKGELTLVFEDRPFNLRKWRVVDAQNAITEVALQNPQTGMALDSDLFYFHAPTVDHHR
ncbi:MAG: outer membrane lipoprotein carrier protein LolA [Azospirillaceae bacterium]|nr:outer membrane lipoprotein carrier protein LolA [Azospirillaceae bacterium]